MHNLQKIVITSVNAVLYLVSLTVTLLVLELILAIIKNSMTVGIAAQIIFWTVIGFSIALLLFSLVMSTLSLVRQKYVFSTIYSALPLVIFSILLLVVTNLPS